MRDQIISILLCLLQVTVGLVLSGLVARLLSIDDYGLYAGITAAILILAVLAQSGIPDVVLRETAGNPDLDGPLLRGLWRDGDRAALPTLGLALALGSGLALWGLAGHLSTVLSAVLFLHIPVMTLLALRAGAMRGLGYANSAHLVMSLVPGIVAIGCLWLSEALGLTTTLEHTMLANLGGLLLATIFCHFRANLSVSPGRPEPGQATRRRFLRKASLPVAGIAGLGIFNAQSDVLMIGWLDSPASSGMYQAAVQIVLVLTIMRARAGMLAARQILGHWKAGDLEAVERATGPAVISVTLFSGLILGAAMIAPGDILAFAFGEGFRAAAPIFTLAALAQFIASLTGMAGYLLILTGHQNHTLIASIGSAAINLLLNPGLIIIWGPIGAAIALFLSTLFWSGYVWYQARRIGIDTSLVAALRHLRAGHSTAAASPAE